MAILQGNAKQGSTRGFYPRVINGSLRFNDDDSAYLSWTPDSAGNRKTWTWSGWVKLGNTFTTERVLFSAGSSASDTGFGQILLANDATIRINAYFQTWRGTTAKLRDPSAWYHIVVRFDSTDATAANRVKVYINGVQQTAFDYNNNPTQNTDYAINQSATHYIGRIDAAIGTGYLDGYLADVYFIDGQALDADDFGETKNGVWVAKDYAGTFGTNGFHLTFEDDTEVEAFNTVLYRGNESSQSITGFGFQPDLVWVKGRSIAENHFLTDVVRGAGIDLRPDSTTAETDSSAYFTSFDNDGFSLAGASYQINKTGDTYVAWGWKAGDSNVSNTDGSITSTVRANQTYGFSIVSYTGTGSDVLIGHGLSSTPEMIITKNRDGAYSWTVTHFQMNGGSAPADNGRMYLNSTDGYGVGSGLYDYAEFTDTVYSINGGDHNLNFSGEDYIAYCWHSVTGYSKFGSYTGGTNPNTITTGFKPAIVIFKNTTTASNWLILDNTRDVVAPQSAALYPNLSNAELDISSYNVEFTDTGFILQNATTDINSSGDTFIYAAFADTREAAFWLDQSGNDNDWQPVNLDHNDTVADSPTDNFATFNPLAIAKYNATGFRTLGTFSDGNLTLTTNADNESGTVTFGASSGKYYMEFTSVNLAQRQQIIVYSTDDYRSDTGAVTTSSDGSGNATDRVSWTTGDVIGIAIDIDSNKVWFHKNGDWFGSSDPSTPTGGDTLSAFTGVGVRQDSGSTGNAVISFNAGQQPFKYDPPA